jgi:hypothetical protein
MVGATERERESRKKTRRSLNRGKFFFPVSDNNLTYSFLIAGRKFLFLFLV